MEHIPILFTVLLIALIIYLRRKIRAKYSHNSRQYETTEGYYKEPESRRDRQLRIIRDSHLATKPLLNKSEARLFVHLSDAIKRYYKADQFLLFSQVSLGEVFKKMDYDEDAYFVLNNMRVDFLLVDRSYKVVAAIEYQGTGHFLGDYNDARKRDKIKKDALTKVGIQYIEVPAKYDLQVLRKKLSLVMSLHLEPHVYTKK